MTKLKIKGQYIKDFSFENPNSPAVYQLLSKSAPDVKVVVNIGSAKLQAKENEENDEFHEVTLHVDIKAATKADANEVDVFRCEVKYCGVFLLGNQIDEEELKRTLLIEAPNFLFPFAREVIARIVGSGGFSPIMLDPIDFATMYEQQSQSINQQKPNHG